MHYNKQHITAFKSIKSATAFLPTVLY